MDTPNPGLPDLFWDCFLGDEIIYGEITTGFIYTMNSTEGQMTERDYVEHFKLHEKVLRMIFGASDYMCSFDAYQFDDYSKVVSGRFDPRKKIRGERKYFQKIAKKPLQ